MASILDMVKKVEKVDFIPNHPVLKENLETKIHYLNGLALMMNVDEEIHESEKNFLSSLIKSFELDASMLKQFVDFAEKPDNDAVNEFFKTLSDNDNVKQIFMMDAILLTEKDGKVHEKEKELLDVYFNKFSFTKKQINNFRKLAKILLNQNLDEAVKFYNQNARFYEKYDFLFQFNEIDVKKVVLEQEEERKYKHNKPIEEKLKALSVEWYEVAARDARLLSKSFASINSSKYDAEMAKLKEKEDEILREIEYLESQLL